MVRYTVYLLERTQAIPFTYLIVTEKPFPHLREINTVAANSTAYFCCLTAKSSVPNAE